MSMILYLRRANDDDLARLRAEPAGITDFFFSDDAATRGDLIDFDKAWQAVHFTLCGAEYYTDNPLGLLLYEGEAIGADMGYGAGWIVPPDAVKAFDQALSNLSDEAIRSRYDPQALAANDVYIADAFVEEPEEGLNYLMQGIPQLRRFAVHCAANGNSVIAAIC